MLNKILNDNVRKILIYLIIISTPFQNWSITFFLNIIPIGILNDPYNPTFLFDSSLSFSLFFILIWIFYEFTNLFQIIMKGEKFELKEHGILQMYLPIVILVLIILNSLVFTTIPFITSFRGTFKVLTILFGYQLMVIVIKQLKIMYDITILGVFCLMTMTIIGLFQRVLEIDTGYPLAGVEEFRVIGTSHNPNFFASMICAYLFFPLLFLIKYRIERKSNILVFFSFLSIILALINLQLTYSRSVVIGIFVSGIVAIFIYLITNYNSIKLKKLIYAVFMVFLIMLPVLFFISNDTFWQYRIDQLFKTQSYFERILIIEVALEMFYDHPITGVGINGFKYRFLEYVGLLEVEAAYELRSVTPHNSFLMFLAEIGVVGFICYLLILSDINLDLIKKMSDTNISKEVYYIPFVILNSLVLNSIFHDMFNKPEFQLIFSLSILFSKMELKI